MKCLDCGGDAVWVDNGRAVGQYHYCRVCKKEEKEWKKRGGAKVFEESLKFLYGDHLSSMPSYAYPPPISGGATYPAVVFPKLEKWLNAQGWEIAAFLFTSLELEIRPGNPRATGLRNLISLLQSIYTFVTVSSSAAGARINEFNATAIEKRLP